MSLTLWTVRVGIENSNCIIGYQLSVRFSLTARHEKSFSCQLSVIRGNSFRFSVNSFQLRVPLWQPGLLYPPQKPL